MTVLGVASGHAYEANPLVEWLIQQHGWAAAGAARGAAVVLPLSVALWARGRGDVYRYLSIPGVALPGLMYSYNAVSDAAVLLDTSLSAAGVVPELTAAAAAYALIAAPAVAPRVAARAAQAARRVVGRVDTEKAKPVGMAVIYLLSVIAVPMAGFIGATGTAAAASSTEWSDSSAPSSGTEIARASDGSVYIYASNGTGTDGLYAYTQDGSVIFEGATASKVGTIVDVEYSNGKVVVSDKSGDVHAFDASTGATVWSYTTTNNKVALAVTNSSVYIRHGTSTFEKLALSDGSVQWSKTKKPLSMAAHDGSIYALMSGGTEVQRIDSSGATVASVSLPVTAAGTGDLPGIDVSDDVIAVADGNSSQYVTVDTSDMTVLRTVSLSYNPSDISVLGDFVAPITDNGGDSVYRSGSLVADTSVAGEGMVLVAESEKVQAVGTGVSVKVDAWLGKSVRGQVVTKDGAPVSGATVRAVALNYSTASIDTDSDAKNILQKLESPKPPQWTPSFNPTDTFSSASAKYVAVHSPEQWGVAQNTIVGDQQLSNPQIQIPAGERVILSVWNPTADGGLINIDRDEAAADLPGAPVERTHTIVVEKLGPGGSVTEQFEFKTDEVISTRGTNFVTKESYHVAAARLPAGFYRIHAKGSPVSYTIAVGDPSEIARQIRQDLRAKSGSLSDHAKYVRSKLADAEAEVYKTTTGPNGKFSLDIPANYRLVKVSAYKGAGLLNDVSLQNRSITKLQQEVLAADYNGSIYYTVAPEKIDPPNRDVTVTVASFPAGASAKPSIFGDMWDRLMDRIQNKSMSWWSSQIPGSIPSNATKTDLKEKVNRLQQVLNKSQATNERYQRLLEQYKQRLAELKNKKPSEVTVKLDDDASKTELKQEIRALRRAISDLRSAVDTTSSTSAKAKNASTSLYTYKVTVGQNVEDLRTSLAKGDVVVTALYNGQQHVVPEQYVSVRDKLTGGAVVTVSDYPVPSGAPTARFKLVGMTASGDPVKDRSEPTKNPQFDGVIPDISGVDVSSLNPSPNSTVVVTLRPADASNFGNVTKVSASAAGKTWRGTVTGPMTAKIPVHGTVPHQIEITYTNTNGTKFSTVVPVVPRSESLERPTSIISKPSKQGRYAMTGGGISGAKIQRAAGTVTVTAVVNQSAGDVPNSIHVYPSGSSPASKYAVSVVDTAGKAVQESVAVTMHTSKLPSDALVYYVTDDGNQQPLTSSPSIHGSVESGPTGNIITLYTDDGEATVRVVEDPTITQQAWWFVETSLPDIPFVGAVIPFAAVIPIGLFGRRTRGESE
ncbi:MAG: PQQ-binding-like beta-propeller repeat protein [Halobacterium sp.]